MPPTTLGPVQPSLAHPLNSGSSLITTKAPWAHTSPCTSIKACQTREVQQGAAAAETASSTLFLKVPKWSMEYASLTKEDTASLEVNARSIMKMKFVKIRDATVKHAEDATQGFANTFLTT